MDSFVYLTNKQTNQLEICEAKAGWDHWVFKESAVPTVKSTAGNPALKLVNAVLQFWWNWFCKSRNLQRFKIQSARTQPDTSRWGNN